MMSCEEETESLSCSPHDNNNGGGVSSRLQLLKKSPVSGSKRTRQRVDAGEPRNSYASIPNFCSRPLLQLPCSNGVLSPPPPQPPNSSSSSSSSASSTASNINNNSITTAAASAKMLNELLGRQLKCELDMGSDSTVDSTDVKMNGQQQQQQQQQQGAMTPNGGSSGVGGGGAVAGGAIAANGTSDNASTGSSGAVGIGVVGGSLVGLLCPDSPPECIGVGGGVSGNNVNRSQLLREILQGKNKDVVVSDNPFVVDGCNGSGRGTTTNNSNNNNSSSSSSSLISQLLKSSSTAASGPNNGVSTTKEDVGGHHYHQHHHHHSNHNNDEEEEDEEPTGTGLHVLSDESEDDEAMEVVVGGGSSPTEAASTGLQCKMNGSSGGGSVSDGGGPPSPAGRGGDNNNTSLCNSSSNNNNNNNNSSSIANNSSINNNNNNNNSDLEIKRARVETIVSGMRSSPCRETSSMAAQVNGCKKRKHYQPQQHDSSLLMHHRGGGYPDDPSPPPKHRRVEREILRKQLREIQQQLMQMQQRYCELFEAESSDSEVVGSSQSEEDGAVGGQAEGVVLHADLAKGDAGLPVDAVVKSESPDELKQSSHVDVLDPAHFIDQARRLVSEQEKLALKEAVSSGTDAKFSSFGSLARLASSSSVSPLTLDVDGLAETLKNELTASLALLIDSILTRFVQRRHQGSHHHHHHHNSKPLDITLNKEVLAAATHMLERHSPRTKVIDRGTGAPLSNNNNNNANNTSGGGIGVGGSVAPSSIPTPSSIIGPPRTHSNGFGSPQPFHSVNSSSDNNGGSNKQQSIQSLFAAVSSKPPLSLYNPHSSSSQSQQQQQHQQQQHHHQTPSPPLPHHPHHPHNNHPYGPGADASGEQNEALSLVVTPKKKRHKVTDTRITPRTVSRLLSQEPADNNNHHHHNSHHNPQKYSPLVSSTHPDSPYHPPPLVPVSLPTSVAIPNPSLHQSDVFSAYPYYHHPRGGSPAEGLDDDAILHPSANLMHASLLNSAVAAVAAAAGGHGSPDTLGMGHFKSENGEVGSDCNSPDVSFDGSGGPVISFHWRSAFPANDKVFLDSGHSSTLTPMHLRKAKLMFFYVRYPSSSILKMYFPDIKFNKNNTAQLVKWFSNFREFFYIQMEKYARQAISEGLKSADDLSVNGDSELYRVLNLHYNRNNHIEVPANFRFVVEQTLREFFKSIIGGKDSEQSWKKSIYKVIARLDDNLPEYFKSPNFLEQLE